MALLSGLGVVVRPKGTRLHKRIGWVYAASMLALNATALMIYDLFGGFGPFHVAALVSLLTLLAGMGVAILRRPKKTWVTHHAYWMSWSYVGLLAAAASEVVTRIRIPGWHFGIAVGVATFVAIGVGAFVINTRLPAILKAFAPTQKEAEMQGSKEAVKS